MAPISRRAFLKSGATLLGVGALSAACGAEAPNAPPAGQATSAAPTAGQAAQATSAAPAVAGEPVPALLRSGDGEEEFFNKAIDLFEQQHAGIKISRVFVPGVSDYTTKLDLMIDSGDPPGTKIRLILMPACCCSNRSMALLKNSSSPSPERSSAGTGSPAAAGAALVACGA